MLAIVTPIKDEINNIDLLINSLEKQSIHIDIWIVVENDSIDGTKEFIEKIKEVSNVRNFIKLSLSFNDKSYQLGYKYSSVVAEGFNHLKNLANYSDIQYIGILDADCFPEANYYEKLIAYLESDTSMGITSGVLLLHDGNRGFSNTNHVRGSGRIWKKICFDVGGYSIGMSADSNSRIKAELRGYTSKVCHDAFFYSREANSRYDLTYGGRSAYYNGFTLTYALIKSVYYLMINAQSGMSYFRGYFNSRYRNLKKNPDMEIIDYNKKALVRLLKSYTYGQ